MIRKLLPYSLVLAICLFAAPVAKADYIYQFSGSDGNGYSISIKFTRPTLESSGGVQPPNVDSSSLTVPNWSNVTLNAFNWFGAAPSSCVGFPFPNEGCVEIGFYGDYLFTGNAGADAIGFPDGSFTSTGTFTSSDGLFTLTIRESNTVPEPASLALLGTGFLALAGFVRRR